MTDVSDVLFDLGDNERCNHLLGYVEGVYEQGDLRASCWMRPMKTSGGEVCLAVDGNFPGVLYVAWSGDGYLTYREERPDVPVRPVSGQFVESLVSSGTADIEVVHLKDTPLYDSGYLPSFKLLPRMAIYAVGVLVGSVGMYVLAVSIAFIGFGRWIDSAGLFALSFLLVFAGFYVMAVEGDKLR